MSQVPAKAASLEDQIAQWRTFFRNRQAIQNVDVAELEDHLREQIDGLLKAGLSTDEAFLVAVKRMGSVDALSLEFAREHHDRLWKQLVIVQQADDPDAPESARTEAFVAFSLAIGAALLVKLPSLFGISMADNASESFYVRNASLFSFPLVATFFAWKRKTLGSLKWLALPFVGAFAWINGMPLVKNSTEVLSALHLPIAMWLPVGIAYAGGRWKDSERRMDFIRFSGELFIYFVLMALGGGLLSGFTAGIFQFAGVKIDTFLQQWLIPCGAAGAVVIGSWLVEAKQSVIENMAPVLTRLFTPMFAAALVTFLVTVLVTGNGVGFNRDLLIGFDAILAVVLALLLYSASARDPRKEPGPADMVQIVLIVAALLADGVALNAIGGRISEFGFTPNRVAALGENVLLAGNLGWSAVLYTRFMRGKETFEALVRWQTTYLPLYAIWAAIVAFLFPLFFPGG
jgi:hypothetical protein